jgi:hypothetical protein
MSNSNGFASDPISKMMRRHALRSFLEETCGSVAKAFEKMSMLAMAMSLGSQGGPGLPEQRMKYKFSPLEFQNTLSQMGYGEGAGTDWWRALFQSTDVDDDGAVSLQDMYDALVLETPHDPFAATGALLLSSDNLMGKSGSTPTRAISPNRSAGAAEGRSGTASNSECNLCGAYMSPSVVFCTMCGTKR